MQETQILQIYKYSVQAGQRCWFCLERGMDLLLNELKKALLAQLWTIFGELNIVLLSFSDCDQWRWCSRHTANAATSTGSTASQHGGSKQDLTKVQFYYSRSSWQPCHSIRRLKENKLKSEGSLLKSNAKISTKTYSLSPPHGFLGSPWIRHNGQALRAWEQRRTSAIDESSTMEFLLFTPGHKMHGWICIAA